MGRPPRARAVECLPRAAFFKPAGVPARDLKHVLLKVDELEALRLADLLGLSQEQAAARLGVSRQTVGRVLEAAHGKVADALVNGKALEIDGGVYRLVQSRCCQDCGHRWVSLRTGRPGGDSRAQAGRLAGRGLAWGGVGRGLPGLRLPGRGQLPATGLRTRWPRS